MGKRKKPEIPSAAAPSAPQAPAVEPAAEGVLPPPAPNGRHHAPEEAAAPSVPPPDPGSLLRDAAEWATECGFKSPFTLTGPEETLFPRHGHGYVVTVHETSGRNRMGTARFNAEGRRAMWTMDGAYTG